MSDRPPGHPGTEGSIFRVPGSAAHGIVVGNSLLVAGVRFEELKQRLLPDIDFKRFAVEDTGYFDWKYGMRRLFSCGVRPDVVVLVMTPRQFMITGVRGEYFAYHLMNLSDVLSVGGEVGASNTLVSDLAFSNLSAFGGIRAEVRKLAAAALLPDLPRLTSLMTRHKARPLDADFVRTESERRLKALKELAGQYRARIILAIPPEGANAGETMAATVQEAGAAAGVSVVVPVPPGSMPDRLFADGFHLNEQGAKVFTSRLADSLQAVIAPQGERVTTGHPGTEGSIFRVPGSAASTKIPVEWIVNPSYRGAPWH